MIAKTNGALGLRAEARKATAARVMNLGTKKSLLRQSYRRISAKKKQTANSVSELELNTNIETRGERLQNARAIILTNSGAPFRLSHTIE